MEAGGWRGSQAEAAGRAETSPDGPWGHLWLSGTWHWGNGTRTAMTGIWGWFNEIDWAFGWLHKKGVPHPSPLLS